MTTIKLNLRDILEEKCLDSASVPVEVSLREFLDYDDDWEHDLDVHELLAAQREIAVIWHVEDVQSVRPDLSDDEAWEVLQAAKKRHDAGIGINWDVLEHHADALYPEPEPRTFEVTVAARSSDTYRVKAANAQAAQARWENGELVRTVQTADSEVLTVTEVQP